MARRGGNRVALWSAVAALAVAGGSGCGGAADLGGSDPDAMGGAPAGSGGRLGEEAPATGGQGEVGGGGAPYVDPDCPEQAPPPTFRECDPLSPEIDCGQGFACLPYLEYPAGEGCGQAGFGTVCVFAGSSTQGEFCESQTCAPGFMCVVGAAGGKRCGQICEPVANHGCPAGLVCGETDVRGYGVCF